MTEKSADMRNAINADFWFSEHQHSGGIFISAAEAEAALAAVPSGISENTQARAAGLIAGRFAGAVEVGADEVIVEAGLEAADAAGFDTIDCPEALLGWLSGWLEGYKVVKTAH